MNTKIYDPSFYAGQREASSFAAQQVLPIVFSLIHCHSMLDVGCGVGTWVSVAMALGIPDVLGIDGDWVDHAMLSVPPDRFRPYDLTRFFDLHRTFDLVTCMEVAEHLDPLYADVVLDNLVRHGDAVLFSAAVPGQGGTNHVNEQWPSYWREKFECRGFRRFDVIRSRIWQLTTVPVCYRQNAYLFVSESRCAKYTELLEAEKRERPEAWVHPDLLQYLSARPLGLRRVLSELPTALKETLRVRLSRLLRLS